MARPGLPEEVRWLITTHVGSALELEVLLAMRVHEGTTTAPELARELRTNEPVASAALEKFTVAGLLARDTEGFEYRPSSPRLAQAADALADSYARRRVRVIELIYRRPSEGVTAFADAFKLRRDD
jgi:DNA-binding IclR family transcriptional regulator